VVFFAPLLEVGATPDILTIKKGIVLDRISLFNFDRFSLCNFRMPFANELELGFKKMLPRN